MTPREQAVAIVFHELAERSRQEYLDGDRERTYARLVDRYIDRIVLARQFDVGKIAKYDSVHSDNLRELYGEDNFTDEWL